MKQQRFGQQLAMHVSAVTIGWNLVLSAGKLAAGLLARSGAMVSDAVHSASDVFSTVIVMVGVKMAGKAPDDDHPYGHERLECVAALLLAAVLFATGLGIGVSGCQKIFSGAAGSLAVPGALALWAAVLSVIIKEAMYWYTRAAAKKLSSSALMADAWHHRSDALSSVGSFAGILGARLGLPVLDPIASVLICLFILKAAIDIFREAIAKMTDRACDEQVQCQLRQKIGAQPGVSGVDRLSTRLFGDRVYVDVEISAPGQQTLQQAHDTARQVHDMVEREFPQVKHCMVHVNPAAD
ncbi:cation diffusion facilitator family transporter [Neobittarella massiliensis]|uniref:Cation transporter n=1 Tax=Neobittarella massiliensis (ex Bilen et al. 2018) TaxID=2041842 RepID=A0A8J6IQK2_9FIRM|nr:cation diffusion facilitator family transporter [Neobittarella massiliensis]MBC3516636.1 cation transporter [Neobittarella massiliensis]